MSEKLDKYYINLAVGTLNETLKKLSAVQAYLIDAGLRGHATGLNRQVRAIRREVDGLLLLLAE